jgi:hypothetical protein
MSRAVKRTLPDHDADAIALRHRIIMPPMSRPRAVDEREWAPRLPTEIAATSPSGSVRNSVFEALLRGYEPALVNRSA